MVDADGADTGIKPVIYPHDIKGRRWSIYLSSGAGGMFNSPSFTCYTHEAAIAVLSALLAPGVSSSTAISVTVNDVT